MMPELSGHDAGQAEALEGPQFLPTAEHLVIIADRSHIEIAGLCERILAHQLAHESRRLREKALGKRQTEHRFAARGDLRRQYAGSRLAQQVFFLHAAPKLPSWMQSCGEGDYVFVEERVTPLDTVRHGDPIAFVAQQHAGKEDFVAEIKRAVQRMPAAYPFRS